MTSTSDGGLTRAGRFFWRTTAHPFAALAVTALALGTAAAFLPGLEVDTRTSAYIPAHHPAHVANDRMDATFGPSEELSILVAVLHAAPGDVFNPDTLAFVSRLSDSIAALPGVEKVDSLATEYDLIATEDAILVRRFLEPLPATPDEAAAVREAVMDFELYVDQLVASDRRATALIVRLQDVSYGESVYDRIMEIIERTSGPDVEAHVAGLGAYQALIGDYIDSDLQRLNPIVGVVLVAMLLLAYRTALGVLLPALAAGGGVVAALGAMSAAGIPMYGITSSLSVILIAIGICDGIHLLGHYYCELAARPRTSPREVVVRTLVELWRPMTLTTLTTSAGFLALSAATGMPPLRWYGVFASLGVVTALLVSLFALPAVLILVPHRPSSAFRRIRAPGSAPSVDWFGRGVGALGRLVYRRPAGVLVVALAVAGVSAIFAVRLERDNEYHQYLDASEPLHRAEIAINRTLGGIQNLHVIVDADAGDEILAPRYLRRIDALQAHVETLPHVKSTRSIADVVKQLHRSWHDDAPAFYAIPDDPFLIAQYFLVMTGDERFEDLVDHTTQAANVWVSFDRSRWSDARAVVPAVEAYLDEHFTRAGIRTELAGVINVNHRVDGEIQWGQLVGVPLAFLAVWSVLALCYRSLLGATLAVLPVGLAILLVYAVMGATGIWLNFATSMTGAIAVGVSVDFAVHALDRMIELLRFQGRPLADALSALFPETGRALLFNCAAVLLGFGVLTAGAVPTIREFGVLVVVCVLTSFLASITLLPALAKLLQPRFLGLGTARPADAVSGGAVVDSRESTGLGPSATR